MTSIGIWIGDFLISLSVCILGKRIPYKFIMRTLGLFILRSKDRKQLRLNVQALVRSRRAFREWLRVDIFKYKTLMRCRQQIRVLVVGSSHAYYGWQSVCGEFNCGTVSSDLYHCYKLCEWLLSRRDMLALESVVLFYDIFYPGYVCEKTAEWRRAVPYKLIYDIPYQVCLSHADKGRLQQLEVDFKRWYGWCQPRWGYRGDPLFHTALPVQKVLRERVESHIKLMKYPEQQNRYVEKLSNILKSNGCKLFVVAPPVEKDYLSYLPRQDLFEDIRRLSLTCGFVFKDYTEDVRVQSSWFMDSDHLTKRGAARFASIVRKDLGLSE